MAREKHLVTPVFGWEFPELGAEANVPEDIHQLLLQIENNLKELETKRLKTAGAGDAGKLLVVEGTGAAAFKAMSGDATLSSAGALTLINEAVNTIKVAALAITEAKLAGEAVGTAKLAALGVTEAKLAALAVGTGKLAEGAVTEAKQADASTSSRKLKPSCGEVVPTEELVLSTAVFADVPGAKLEITPATASKLFIWSTWDLSSPTTAKSFALCSLSVDGAAELAKQACLQFKKSAEAEIARATIHQSWVINLTAAAHTIKMRAKLEAATGNMTLNKTGTGFNWMLVSQ